MTRRRRYGNLDDAPVLDGDNGFIGFASGIAADTLPQGIAALAENMRSSENVYGVRPGNKLLKENEDISCPDLILSFDLGCQVSAASLTRVGSVATFVATADHKFLDGQLVAMECAEQPEYNIDAEIVFINATTFSYTVAGAPATPATGTPIASSGPQLGNVSDNGIRHSIEWRDPLTLETRILRARATEAELTDPDDPTNCIAIPYPIAETIGKDEPAWLTQVNDRVILHRGFQQPALEWFNDETEPFLFKAETGSVKWNMPRSSWSVYYQNRLIVPLESIPIETTSITRIGLLATMTTLKPSGLVKGEKLVITNGNSFLWDGTYLITGTPGPNLVEFTLLSLPPTTDAGGTAQVFITHFDELIISDILDTDTYDNINARFRINAGGSDNLIFAYPWLDDQVLIFMRYSVHLIAGITDISNAVVKEITREVGCSSRGSVAGGGPFVIFRQDNNLFLIQAGEELKLQWKTTPISHPDIEDIMGRVTAISSNESWATYFDNRYWIALPIDGNSRNTRVLAYNLPRQQWESFDTLPDTFNPDFMHKARFGNKQARVGSTYEGALYVFDVLNGEEDGDEIGPIAALPDITPQIFIPGAVDTRKYAGGLREIKRWIYAQLSMTLTTLQTITATPSLEDPDLLGETISRTGTLTKDPLVRFRIGRRGRALQIQWRTSGGRPQLRNTLVEGAINDRSVKGFN